MVAVDWHCQIGGGGGAGKRQFMTSKLIKSYKHAAHLYIFDPCISRPSRPAGPQSSKLGRPSSCRMAKGKGLSETSVLRLQRPPIFGRKEEKKMAARKWQRTDQPPRRVGGCMVLAMVFGDSLIDCLAVDVDGTQSLNLSPRWNDESSFTFPRWRLKDLSRGGCGRWWFYRPSTDRACGMCDRDGNTT